MKWGKRKLTDGQKRREANQNAQKRRVAEYKSQRALLANEYRQNEKPDYSHIFDYGDDGLSQMQKEISEAIRSWVRYGLQKKMTYDQIKSIVVSEFRLHRDIMKRFNLK